MIKAEDSQQAAELRQAFVRHLPKRVSVVQRRLRRLAQDGWDINALTLIFEEVQALAGTSGRYGVLKASDALYALELALSGYVERMAIPSETESIEIERLLHGLDSIGEQQVARPAQVQPGPRFDAPAELVVGALDVAQERYPSAVRPPSSYWLRFAELADPVESEAVGGDASVASEIDAFVEFESSDAEFEVDLMADLRPHSAMAEPSPAPAAAPEPVIELISPAPMAQAASNAMDVAEAIETTGIPVDDFFAQGTDVELPPLELASSPTPVANVDLSPRVQTADQAPAVVDDWFSETAALDHIELASPADSEPAPQLATEPAPSPRTAVTVEIPAIWTTIPAPHTPEPIAPALTADTVDFGHQAPDATADPFGDAGAGVALDDAHPIELASNPSVVEANIEAIAPPTDAAALVIDPEPAAVAEAAIPVDAGPAIEGAGQVAVAEAPAAAPWGDSGSWFDPATEAPTRVLEDAAPTASVEVKVAVEPSSQATALGDTARAEPAAAAIAPVAPAAAIFSDGPAPAKAAPAPAARKPIIESAAEREPGRIYYLWQRNEFSNRLREKFEASGDEVEAFDNADELIAMTQALKPDLVLIDPAHAPALALVGAALRPLRSKPGQRVGFMVLTNNNDLQTRLAALRAGVDVYAAAPLDVADLHARARELLSEGDQEAYRVAIIEDDRSQALFAESILRRAGMEVEVVHDALSALDVVDRFKPDMILMDLYMPDCDGVELTTIIRERPQFIHTPIVFLSGEQDQDKHFDALSAGGDDFLSKPIRPKHLLSAVSNRIQRARQMARRQSEALKLDPRSGLYERAFLVDRVSELLAHEHRAEIAGAVLFIEVENPFQLRDKLGLSSFEALVSHVGSIVQSLAERDVIGARSGDYHFLMLVTGREATAIDALAAKLRARIAEHPIEQDGQRAHVSIAIGVCGFADEFADAGQMINAAERACSLARHSTTQKIKHYQPAAKAAAVLAPVISEDRLILEALRSALRDGSFLVTHLPLVGNTGAAADDPIYQVMLRLRVSNGQIVGSSKIQPLAEREQLGAEVDRWMLSRALSLLDDKQRQGSKLRLIVSQSAASVKDPQRASWIRQVLETRRLKPDRLIIELKLIDVLQNLKPAVGFGLQLKQFGVRACLSGFDGAQIGFQLLSHLPVEFVRMSDKFFVTDPKLDDELKTSTLLTRKLGKRVIFGRLDEPALVSRFAALGADLLQGKAVQSSDEPI